MGDELQPPKPPHELFDPGPQSHPPPVVQHYHAAPQHAPAPVYVNLAPRAEPRLEAGGWFARAFASTTGIILAVLFFLFVVPTMVMMLACGGCAVLFSNVADETLAEIEREEARQKQRLQEVAAETTYPDLVALPEESEPEPVKPVVSSSTTSKEEPALSLSQAEVARLAEEARRQLAEEQAALEQRTAERIAERERIAKAERTRTWKSPSGKFSVEAEFVRYANGTVTLRKADGEELQVESEKLSEGDRAWIRSRR